MILHIKTKWLWVSRFFATALIFGGLGGTAISIVTAYQLSHQSWVKPFTGAALTALYLFVVVIGVALWRNKHYGKTWAAILFALQMPIFSSPALSYEWFTGMSIKFVSSNGNYGWLFELGGSDTFHLQSDAVAMAYGCNVFAACALIYLLIIRAKNSFTPKPLCGSA